MVLLSSQLVGSKFMAHSFVAIACQYVMLPCKFNVY